MLILLHAPAVRADEAAPFKLEIEQLTAGDKHHFFGYIGQCRTIPWNAGGRYVLGMEIDRIDRMPESDEAATIILLDTHVRSAGVDKGPYGGDIRIDPAPRWNRTNDAILVPGIAENGTRQMFLIRILSADE